MICFGSYARFVRVRPTLASENIEVAVPKRPLDTRPDDFDGGQAWN
jgi:hypothetical protein